MSADILVFVNVTHHLLWKEFLLQSNPIPGSCPTFVIVIWRLQRVAAADQAAMEGEGGRERERG
jgi:hypothetical protein